MSHPEKRDYYFYRSERTTVFQAAFPDGTAVD
jgi:hypothetical protein